ncbi:hypothetical protein SAMN05877842_101362 [Ureibacillus acetophenoni]|uniref:Sporulation integral membrane protein YlbJ n=2 Tax=Ureibacillus acetophenoni TaxID=614649 RepID=A0A285U4W0_9BACL|nr:hypothetical protein SAMN05877842_101362 [Ureibacillus acetophenoni]
MFPGVAHEGTDLGVNLFMEALFPYLLPYLILTQWFIRLTPNQQQSSSRLQLYLKTYGISALGGFPTGAATIAFLKKSRQISTKEANGLLSICHSPSPLFVIGFVGYDLLNDTMFSWRFLILYHIVSFVILIIFYKTSSNKDFHISSVTSEKIPKPQNPFISSIKDSVPTVLVVGSTLIFFTTIYTVVMHTISTFVPTIHNSLILLTAASLEMTNGLQITSEMFSGESTMLYLLLALFLTTQSLSIHMQVAVLAKNERISLRPYVALRVILALLIPALYYVLFLL